MITSAEARKESIIQFSATEYYRMTYNGMNQAERASDDGRQVFKDYLLAKKRFEYYASIANETEE